MPRFQTLAYAPFATRDYLRQRLQRHLPAGEAIEPLRLAGPDISDSELLRLLESVRIDSGADAARFEATYAARATANDLSFHQAHSEGWFDIYGGRILMMRSLQSAVERSADTSLTALQAVMRTRYETVLSFPTFISEDPTLATFAAIIAAEGRLDQLRCTSPEWVAARLWERLAAVPDDLGRLQDWLRRWELLGAPRFVPSEAWSEDDRDAFHAASYALLSSDPGLLPWSQYRAREAQQAALVHSRAPATPAAAANDLLAQAETLMPPRGEPTWMEGLPFGGLVGLLLEDVIARPEFGAHHTRGDTLMRLLLDRPQLLVSLVSTCQHRPILLADLLMVPDAAPLAAWLIGRLPPVHERGFNGAALARDQAQGRLAVFSDAVSVVGHLFHGGEIGPAAVANLLAHLHARSWNAADIHLMDALRAELLEELLTHAPASLALIVEALAPPGVLLKLTDARYQAALNLIARAALCGQVDATTFVASYIEALQLVEYAPAVGWLDAGAAAALADMAARTPALWPAFQDPVDVRAQLETATEDDRHAVAAKLESLLRLHIRTLSRAIASGRAEPDEELVAALKRAITIGAQRHEGKRKVAAFAPHHELSPIGSLDDVPIAVDLAAALRAVAPPQQDELAIALLGVDEPYLLAELLQRGPERLRQGFARQLQDLPPQEAARPIMLTDLMGRVRALQDARLPEIAALYIAAEKAEAREKEPAGREAARFTADLRQFLLRQNWDALIAAQPPALKGLDEITARDSLTFYQGLAFFYRHDLANLDEAERCFERLHKNHPDVPAYRSNLVATRIGRLLWGDLFKRLEGEDLQAGLAILAEVGSRPISSAEGEELHGNLALLHLACSQPEAALKALAAIEAEGEDPRAIAYRAVALARLGRPRQATATLEAVRKQFPDVSILGAAYEHITNGSPSGSVVAMQWSNEHQLNIKGAFTDFQVLPPELQATVLGFDGGLAELLNDAVTQAGASLTNLSSTLASLDTKNLEDDITAIFRELLITRLRQIAWSPSDQSKGGVTAAGNSGERDLVIRSGSRELTVIEAVNLKTNVNDTALKDLRAHFVKLFDYSRCRTLFHVTYDHKGRLNELLAAFEIMASDGAPAGYKLLGADRITPRDTGPCGLRARYETGLGEVEVNFYVIDLSQLSEALARRSGQ